MSELKRALTILLAVAVMLSCTGCLGVEKVDQYSLVPESTGGTDVEPAPAADNVFSLNYNPKYSLNPLTATNHSNQLVCNLVYENMVEIDGDFNVIPNIIKEWSCTEDGKIWTLTIDTTHVFHDGTPVRGKDVDYTIQKTIFSDRFSGRFASFQGTASTDDKVMLYLGIGDTQIIKLLNIPVIKYGSFTDKKEEHPIGSGPYTFSEDMTQLLAYEGYPGYDDLPVDTIYLVNYTTADETISAFEDSIIDVVMNDPSSYSNLGYASINETHTFATTNLHYVVINQNSDIGKYSAFRYAMNYAFDRDNFADNLMVGNAVASSVPMYPTCEYYPTAFAKSLDYDIDMCKRVLENGGILDYDDDGKLELSQGAKDLTVTFLLCSDSSAKAGVVRKFSNDMESIGIKVETSSLPWDDYLDALKEGEFDLYYGEIKLRGDFDITELFDERNKDNEDYNINYSGCKDPNYKNYINAYLSASDYDRATRYEEMVRYVTDNGALIAIGFEKQQIITHRGIVRGVNPNIGNPLYDFQNWQINLDY